jgi:hypothetical protein
MMTIESLRLDGNAIAGILYEVFGVEMTTYVRACHSCRSANAIGAYHVYRGAGTVLRCPVCSDMALTVASGREDCVVRLQGVWTLQLPRA